MAIQQEPEWQGVKRVARRYDVSPPTIWRWVREDPKFPKPVRIGKRSSRWNRRTLEEYDAACTGEAA
jgi:prophage regulatory protein